MAPRRSRKPAATIQKKESRQAEPGARAMAGAGAAVCEVSVFTAIVGKVYLFSHDHRDGSTQTAWPQAPIPQPPTWPQAPIPQPLAWPQAPIPQPPTWPQAPIPVRASAARLFRLQATLMSFPRIFLLQESGHESLEEISSDRKS